jgi:hypothetical protein
MRHSRPYPRRVPRPRAGRNFALLAPPETIGSRACPAPIAAGSHARRVVVRAATRRGSWRACRLSAGCTAAGRLDGLSGNQEVHVATHEIGHALSFGHPADPAAQGVNHIEGTQSAANPSTPSYASVIWGGTNGCFTGSGNVTLGLASDDVASASAQHPRSRRGGAITPHRGADRPSRRACRRACSPRDRDRAAARARA